MGRPYGNCRGGDRTTSRGASHGWWRGVVQHRGEVEHQERSTLGAAGAGAVVVDSGYPGRGAGCATVGAAVGATIIAPRSGNGGASHGRFAAGGGSSYRRDSRRRARGIRGTCAAAGRQARGRFARPFGSGGGSLQ
jgi:hypothetical protein